MGLERRQRLVICALLLTDSFALGDQLVGGLLELRGVFLDLSHCGGSAVGTENGFEGLEHEQRGKVYLEE
jgi:hypothetical protein